MKHVGPGEYEEQPLTGAKGDALAIDIASGTIYGVDPEQAGTDEYNAKLEFGAKIGEGYTDRVQAVAVDDATHHLLTLSEGGQVHAFGPGAVIPDVVLTAPSLAPRSVELRGTVNPDETVITGCEFELVAEGSVPAKQPCEPVLGTGHTPMGVGARFSGLVPNARYTERLAAGNSSGSNSTQPLYIKTAAALPTTNDAPPVVSAVTRTSAVLSGVVNPEHSSTTYHFLFGSSAAYGSATASISAGAELGDRTVVQRIEGLKSGTTYHFAVVAENQAGSSTSVDRSFTTSPPTPPSVSDVTVNGIQPGAASISGNVDADGLPTSYEIDFGSDTSYATRIGGEVAGASQALSLTLLYLEPGTTYHYRVVARNEDGEAASADQTFTTPRYPIVLPEVLPQLALPAIAFPAEKADADAKHKAKKAKPKKKSKPHGKFKAKSKHRKKK
jgi:hypothetical protein